MQEFLLKRQRNKMAKVVKKGKKNRKPRVSSKRWSKYKIEGETAKTTQRFCPRCGAGIFLAQSKNRLFCGKCHYTEFLSS
jgi:small subunit ribosomal protein S27Ae